jgi:pantothenate kinase
MNQSVVFDGCLSRAQALLQSGQRRLLGLVGEPGAGKSTLALALQQALGEQAVVVPMDGFHLANVQLQRLGRRQRKGAPDTFDAHGYVALLQRLRQPQVGQTVYAPAFERGLEEPLAGAIAVPPEVPLVITEGNYLLLDEAPWDGIRALLDEVWMLNPPADLRRARLLARHQQFGRSATQAQAWVDSTDEPNAQRIRASAQRADWWVPLG